MRPYLEKITVAPHTSFRLKVLHQDRFEFSWHLHPELELTLILEGRGTRFVGDHLEEFREGDLVLLGPGLAHTWSSAPLQPRRAGSHRAVVIQFDEHFLGREFLLKPELGAIRRLFQRARRGLRFWGEEVAAQRQALSALESRDGLERVLGLLQVLEGLAGARSAKPLSSPGFAPPCDAQEHSRIDKVCGHLSAHFQSPLTQREAAQMTHLSVSAFSRFFRKATGKHFKAYLNELRVGHACQALIESDRTVAEICFAAGYQNLSNFNRRFRQLKGMSPQQYRRRFCVDGEAGR